MIGECARKVYGISWHIFEIACEYQEGCLQGGGYSIDLWDELKTIEYNWHQAAHNYLSSQKLSTTEIEAKESVNRAISEAWKLLRKFNATSH